MTLLLQYDGSEFLITSRLEMLHLTITILEKLLTSFQRYWETPIIGEVIIMYRSSTKSFKNWFVCSRQIGRSN